MGGGTHQNQSNMCDHGEQTADDRTYEIEALAAGNLTVRLDASLTDYDSVLYVLDECLDATSHVACDNAGMTGGEMLTVAVQANDVVELVVDGDSGAEGNYRLEFTLTP